MELCLLVLETENRLLVARAGGSEAGEGGGSKIHKGSTGPRGVRGQTSGSQGRKSPGVPESTEALVNTALPIECC